MQVSKVTCLRRNNYRIAQKQNTAPVSQKQEHINSQDPYNWSNKNLHNLRIILLKRPQNKVQGFFTQVLAENTHNMWTFHLVR